MLSDLINGLRILSISFSLAKSELNSPFLKIVKFLFSISRPISSINKSKYFVGVPSPAAAFLILFTLFAYFQFNLEFLKNAFLNSLIILIIGLMMISKIPTISIKNFTFNSNYAPWSILGVAIVSIGIISNIWLTILIGLSIYIVSVFYIIIINLKKIK